MILDKASRLSKDLLKKTRFALVRPKNHSWDDVEVVVIILVLDRDERADVDQALRSAMTRERERAPVFDALLTHYSLATAERFTWVD